ncbi:MAG: DUF4861 domain-containing protein [Prevotellaceae bacterium]|jgi:hypothetical protein|nr:DUF4861 domain-containing protein [Prevotellaceae bacterium]
MKKTILSAFLLAFVANALAAMDFMPVAVPNKTIFVTVSNPNDFERKNQPVVIPLAETRERWNACEIDARTAVFVDDAEISSQADDLDGDGLHDELAFLIDLQPNETKTIELRRVPMTEPQPKFPKEVQAQMYLRDPKTKAITPTTEASSGESGTLYRSLHHHGVAFESALVAYRVYFDKRITVDIYGKVKEQLELDTAKWYPTKEQLAGGFGDDILLVGEGVGVGSVKGWDGKQAMHIEPVKNRTQRIVSQGNIRTIVDIINDGWTYNGDTVDMTVRYIMYARHRDVEAQVFTDSASNGEVVVATGVQKFPVSVMFDDNDGVKGTWATEWSLGDTLVATRQTFGLGVAVPKANRLSSVEDSINSLILMSSQGAPSFTFYLTSVSAKEEKGVKTINLDGYVSYTLRAACLAYHKLHFRRRRFFLG